MSTPDLYNVLNVSKDASVDEIKKAFKKMAIQCHPDKCRNDSDDVKAEKEEKFKKLNEAYTILSDTEKKARYDQFGIIDDAAQPSGNGNMDDILRDIFGRGGGGFPMQGGASFSFSFMDGSGRGFQSGGLPPGFEAMFGGHPQNIKQRNKQDTIEVGIDINDIYYGQTKRVEFEMHELCEPCKGTGAQDPSHLLKCMTCGGNGNVHQQVGPFFTQAIQCPSCAGQGTTVQHNKQCVKCKGKKLVFNKKVFELKLPKGIPNQYEVVMEGKGAYNMDTKCSNDMKFRFIYKIQEPYTLDNDKNVHYVLKITLEELLGGFTKVIDLYKESYKIVSEHYFNPTKTLVLFNQGLYDMLAEKQRDLHIHFHVEYSDNERYKKYGDVIRKVLKVSQQEVPTDEEKNAIYVNKFL